jgi:hypothetical protein
MHTETAILFLTKRSKTYNGKKTALSTNVAGKIEIHMQQSEIRSIFHPVPISIQSVTKTLM